MIFNFFSHRQIVCSNFCITLAKSLTTERVCANILMFEHP